MQGHQAFWAVVATEALRAIRGWGEAPVCAVPAAAPCECYCHEWDREEVCPADCPEPEVPEVQLSASVFLAGALGQAVVQLIGLVLTRRRDAAVPAEAEVQLPARRHGRRAAPERRRDGGL